MKYKHLFIIFLSILLTSCSTMQNIYTIMAENGQIYFIRSVKTKKTPNTIKSFEFDITVHTSQDGEIIKNPVINYTFEFDKMNYSALDSSSFYFLCNEKQILPFESSIIYKEIGDKKNLNVRYTSNLSINDFYELLSNADKVTIVLATTNQSVEQKNEDFIQKLKEIGVLIK